MGYARIGLGAEKMRVWGGACARAGRLGVVLGTGMLISAQAWGLELEIAVQLSNPSRPVFYGRTNLPDGAELGTTLACPKQPDGKIGFEKSVIVHHGNFKIDPVSSSIDRLEPGFCILYIGMPEKQPPEVSAIVGKSLENLTGKYMMPSIPGMGIVDFRTRFDVP